MPKLNLVIADGDEDYAANLLAYLAENYCDRFKVTVFTKRDYLAQYLQEGKCRVDILLITQEMYQKGIPHTEQTVIIFLSSGYIEAGCKACKHIDKYRHVDLLAGDISDIYAESSNNDLDTVKKRRETKIITVYSPSGGIGKTSIAIGLCILAAKKGFTVFYLNLEYTQSTKVFFNGVNSNTLSTVLYHIRQKSSNLPVRIESSSCIDNELGVNFFLPPDNSRDIDDLIIEDLDVLINKLKSCGKYDMIIIDLSDSFDKRNKYLLEHTDAAVFISGQDKLSQAKLSKLINELAGAESNTEGMKAYQKHFVLNKYNSSISDESRAETIIEPSFDIKIPYLNNIDLSRDMHRVLRQHCEYTSCLKKLLENLIRSN